MPACRLKKARTDAASGSPSWSIADRVYSSTRLRDLPGRAVLEDLRAVDDPLAKGAHERVVVVVQQRARQRLDGLPPQEVRLVDHVLLLEAADGQPHGVVVDARLVLGPLGRVQQPLAGQALFDRRHRRLLGGALGEQLDLRRELRLLRDQLVQRRRVRLAAGGFQVLPDARQAALVLLDLGRRDVGHRLDGVQRVGALLVVAGVRLVVEEAGPQHGDRREDPVELEVVLRARRQRLAVLVELVVGEPDEDPAVAVGQGSPSAPVCSAKMYGRPVVRQVDQRVAGGLRQVGVDPALFARAGRLVVLRGRGADDDQRPSIGRKVRPRFQGLRLGHRPAWLGRGFGGRRARRRLLRRRPGLTRVVGGRTFAVQLSRLPAAKRRDRRTDRQGAQKGSPHPRRQHIPDRSSGASFCIAPRRPARARPSRETRRGCGRRAWRRTWRRRRRRSAAGRPAACGRPPRRR